MEGTIIADAGYSLGIATATIDLDKPRLQEMSHGGEIADARKFLLNDRRGETYGRICKT